MKRNMPTWIQRLIEHLFPAEEASNEETKKSTTSGHTVLPEVEKNNEILERIEDGTLEDIIKLQGTPYIVAQNCREFFTFDREIQVEDLKAVGDLSPERAIHVYGYASQSSNGYVREAALGHMALILSVEALPYLLLRLNDWVEEVRNKAIDLLEKLYPMLDVNALLEHGDIIEGLMRKKRPNVKGWIGKIVHTIGDPSNRKFVFSKIDSSNRNQRLFLWRILFSGTIDDELIDRALEDQDALVRGMTIPHLPQGARFESRIRKLFSEKTSILRYMAIKAIPSDQQNDLKDIFIEGMFDTSRGVRAYACFTLKASNVGDFAEQYRLRLAEEGENPTIGTILGLGETGNEEDAALLMSLFISPNAQVRWACLIGLDGLDAENGGDFFLKGLQDKSARVRQISIKLLTLKHRHLRPQIEDLLTNEDVRVQVAALRVLVQGPILESLNSILLALLQPSEGLQLQAWKAFLRWYTHYSAHPWGSCRLSELERADDLIDKVNQKGTPIPDVETHMDLRTAWSHLPELLQVLRENLVEAKG